MAECSIDDCDRDALTRGWCSRHYDRWKRHGDPVFSIYSVDRTVPCSAPGCTAVATYTGKKITAKIRDPYCQTHYRRAKDGEPLVRERERGDGTIKDGYVYLVDRNHPFARKSGYIAEHRLVMERILGRYLLPEENVHHKNGVKDDNRPENLELWNTSQPSGQRVSDKLEWALRIVALYGDIRAVMS